MGRYYTYGDPNAECSNYKGNNNNNGGCCCCECEQGKEKESNKKKKKKSEKKKKGEKKNCEDILPDKSGYYKFTKTQNKFLYFPEEMMKPKMPQIIIQPAAPPMPPPPAPIEDIQIIEALDEDSDEDDCVLQPIIQPIMMQNNMCNPFNPYPSFNPCNPCFNPCNPCFNPCNPCCNPCNPCCNPCNPCCNPCNSGCCNSHKSCCNKGGSSCTNSKNGSSKSSNSNCGPGFGNGISISGKEFATGNPVIPMCIPMMPSNRQRQQRKCVKRPPQMCYPPPQPYGCAPRPAFPPNGGGFPPYGGFGGMQPPMMGNRPPFPPPPPPPPPPQTKKPVAKPKAESRRHSSDAKKSSKKSRSKSTSESEEDSEENSEEDSEGSEEEATDTKQGYSTSYGYSGTPTNDRLSYYSDNIVIPGMPASAFQSDIGSVIPSGQELTTQRQKMNSDGSVATTVDLAPGRGDNIEIVATDNQDQCDLRNNITAMNANTETENADENQIVEEPMVSASVASTATMAKGDMAEVVGPGSPRSIRSSRNSRGSRVGGTPSDVRAMKEELNRYIPKDSIGTQSQRRPSVERGPSTVSGNNYKNDERFSAVSGNNYKNDERFSAVSGNNYKNDERFSAVSGNNYTTDERLSGTGEENKRNKRVSGASETNK